MLCVYTCVGGRGERHQKEKSPDSERWGAEGDVQCGGANPSKGKKSISQWEMHGANLGEQSAAGVTWVGCPRPRVGAAGEAEQLAWEEGCGSRADVARGWSERVCMGTGKPVPPAQAGLRLLFWVRVFRPCGCSASPLPGNAAEGFRTGKCFPRSPCPEMPVTDFLIYFLQSCFCVHVTLFVCILNM